MTKIIVAAFPRNGTFFLRLVKNPTLWSSHVTATGRRVPSRSCGILEIRSRLLLTMGGKFYDPMASRDPPFFYEFTKFNDKATGILRDDFSSSATSLGLDFGPFDRAELCSGRFYEISGISSFLRFAVSPRTLLSSPRYLRRLILFLLKFVYDNDIYTVASYAGIVFSIGNDRVVDTA